MTIPSYTVTSRVVKGKSGNLVIVRDYGGPTVVSGTGDTRSADLLLQVSLRLKAARHLAGGRSADGKRAVPLAVSSLAEHEVLRRNQITKNRLEDYEQMTIAKPVPMELEKIAEALRIPRAFLLEPIEAAEAAEPAFGVEDAVAELQRVGEVLRIIARQQGRDVGLRDRLLPGATDRPPESPPAAA
jgi:transcriptional regulator with XRE-family HTH domain